MEKVNCNKCKKDFVIKVKVKKYPGGIEELYFTCPRCKERYTAYYIDEKGKELQKRIRVMYNQLTISNNKEKVRQNIKNAQTILKIRMDNLKIQMEGTR